MRVSSLVPGAEVALPGLDVASSPCRVIVSFSPDCPFCKHAAARERDTARSRPSMRATWITGQPTPALDEFLPLLEAGTKVIVDEGTFNELHPHGVPGLYLIDDEDVLRWVGPYRGDETEGTLTERCQTPVTFRVKKSYRQRRGSQLLLDADHSASDPGSTQPRHTLQFVRVAPPASAQGAR